MELRRERVELAHLPASRLGILHISDVHFSEATSHEKNLRVTEEILELAKQCGTVHAVCMTGDLVSRKFTRGSLDDAVALVRRLREFLPDSEILYSMGNHETDLPEEIRKKLTERIRHAGATVLDNEQKIAFSSGDNGIQFAGLTLPQEVYKNPNGTYFRLSTITSEMVENCLPFQKQQPCVLLAHSPLGFPAYAQWGADLVLSGHVHGGIVRVGNVGLLSPERRFLPKYTKGLFCEDGCVMNVSAGIGKFRVNNPAEVIYLELVPKE